MEREPLDKLSIRSYIKKQPQSQNSFVQNLHDTCNLIKDQREELKSKFLEQKETSEKVIAEKEQIIQKNTVIIKESEHKKEELQRELGSLAQKLADLNSALKDKQHEVDSLENKLSLYEQTNS